MNSVFYGYTYIASATADFHDKRVKKLIQAVAETGGGQGGVSPITSDVAHSLGAHRKQAITFTNIRHNYCQNYQIRLRIKHCALCMITNDAGFFSGFLTALLTKKTWYLKHLVFQWTHVCCDF